MIIRRWRIFEKQYNNEMSTDEKKKSSLVHETISI